MSAIGTSLIKEVEVKEKRMSLVKGGGSMTYHVPVLTPTNYLVWAVKVKSIMDAHDIWETVEPKALGETSDKKKSKQALAFLFQAILKDMVLQMASYTEPKKMWDGLKTRLLDSMPKSFLQIVASIEQCFGLDSMLFDEAVGRLKAYEERIRGTEKVEDIQGGLLLASEKISHVCKHCGNGRSNRDDFGRDRGRGRGFGRSRDANERVRDKSHVRCYKYGKFGHYKNKRPEWEKEEASLIEE
uniref:DUF4219 domain-containing protein n=1 Tax=Lactuca sativa TaxID=4236 RepID=A0A9R1V8D3_LACSA|nr:hypothetical protein LSAT_V11C600301050 [Lactuca sativa]